MDIAEVIVPANPGVFSAWGMLQADIRHDAAHTCVGLLETLTEDKYMEEFNGLYEKLEHTLCSENIDPGQGKFVRTLDMRYYGQEYTISVDMEKEGFEAKKIEELFSRTYERLYGHHSPDDKVEVVNYRLTVMVPIRNIPVSSREGKTEQRPLEVIQGYFDGQEAQMRVYDRGDFHVGTVIEGPAIVVELTSTTVIPPGWKVVTDAHNNMILSKIENRG